MTSTRTLIVADSDTFADAVYRLGLDINTVYRADSLAHAIERAAVWSTQGIASTTLDTSGVELATHAAGPVSPRTRVMPIYVARGEASGQSKLTDAKVREIRQRWPTATGPQLAREYGVSASAISAVVTGRSWGHVDLSEEDTARGDASQSPTTPRTAAMARP